MKQKKVADQLWEAKLVRSNIDFFQDVEKIDKAYIDYDEIWKKLVRITIVIDEHKVIWQFDYSITKQEWKNTE